MTTGKTIAVTRQTFVGKVMSLLFNVLSRFPSKECLLISWLQSPSAVILEHKKLGFPGGSDGKVSALPCNVGDLDSIPGSGRSP